jgi:hypothetical protein
VDVAEAPYIASSQLFDDFKIGVKSEIATNAASWLANTKVKKKDIFFLFTIMSFKQQGWAIQFINKLKTEVPEAEVELQRIHIRLSKIQNSSDLMTWGIDLDSETFATTRLSLVNACKELGTDPAQICKSLGLNTLASFNKSILDQRKSFLCEEITRYGDNGLFIQHFIKFLEVLGIFLKLGEFEACCRGLEEIKGNFERMVLVNHEQPNQLFVEQKFEVAVSDMFSAYYQNKFIASHTKGHCDGFKVMDVKNMYETALPRIKTRMGSQHFWTKIIVQKLREMEVDKSPGSSKSGPGESSGHESKPGESKTIESKTNVEKTRKKLLHAEEKLRKKEDAATARKNHAIEMIETRKLQKEFKAEAMEREKKQKKEKAEKKRRQDQSDTDKKTATEATAKKLVLGEQKIQKKSAESIQKMMRMKLAKKRDIEREKVERDEMIELSKINPKNLNTYQEKRDYVNAVLTVLRAKENITEVKEKDERQEEEQLFDDSTVKITQMIHSISEKFPEYEFVVVGGAAVKAHHLQTKKKGSTSTGHKTTDFDVKVYPVGEVIPKDKRRNWVAEARFKIHSQLQLLLHMLNSKNKEEFKVLKGRRGVVSCQAVGEKTWEEAGKRGEEHTICGDHTVPIKVSLKLQTKKMVPLLEFSFSPSEILTKDEDYTYMNMPGTDIPLKYLTHYKLAQILHQNITKNGGFMKRIEAGEANVYRKKILSWFKQLNSLNKMERENPLNAINPLNALSGGTRKKYKTRRRRKKKSRKRTKRRKIKKRTKRRRKKKTKYRRKFIKKI